MFALLLSLAMASPARIHVFQNKEGKVITVDQAFEISAKGETVYRCQVVKAAVNKTGTSVSFKVAK